MSDGLNEKIIKAVAGRVLRNILGDDELQVWIGVRRPGEEEMVYEFLALEQVRVGDEVTVQHVIGDIDVGEG